MDPLLLFYVESLIWRNQRLIRFVILKMNLHSQNSFSLNNYNYILISRSGIARYLIKEIDSVVELYNSLRTCLKLNGLVCSQYFILNLQYIYPFS
jgi:hypothetical protein